MDDEVPGLEAEALIGHEDFTTPIADGVRQGMAGFRDAVELEDCQQEALLAFYSDKCQEALAEMLEEEGDTARFVFGFTRAKVRRFCEKERAARFGYEVSDLHSYSPKWVRDLLPDALAYELTGDLPQAPDEARVSGGGDASDGKGTLVSLIDVLTGVGALGDRDREILTMVFFHQWSDGRVAEELGVAESSVPTTVSRVVGRLCSHINNRRRAADEEHEGPGSRRTVSNSTARRLVDAGGTELPLRSFFRPRRALRQVPAHDQPELQ